MKTKLVYRIRIEGETKMLEASKLVGPHQYQVHNKIQLHEEEDSRLPYSATITAIESDPETHAPIAIIDDPYRISNSDELAMYKDSLTKAGWKIRMVEGIEG